MVGAELRSFTPTWGDQLRVGMQELLGGLGARKYFAQDAGSWLQGLLGNLPITGNVLAGNQMSHSAGQGDLLGAVLSGAAAVAPAGAGLAAKAVPKAVAMAAPEARAAAKPAAMSLEEELASILNSTPAKPTPPAAATQSATLAGQPMNMEAALQMIADALGSGQFPKATAMAEQKLGQKIPITEGGKKTTSLAEIHKWEDEANEAFKKGPDFYQTWKKDNPKPGGAFNPDFAFKSNDLNPFEAAAATGDNSALIAAEEKAKAEAMPDKPLNATAQNFIDALGPMRGAAAQRTKMPKAPVDETTRQQRRIDAGFTTPAYHGSSRWGDAEAGTGKEIAKSETTLGTSRFYAAEQPDLADMYAGVYPYNTPATWGSLGKNNSSVQPLYLNTKDFHVHDAGGRNWSDPAANDAGIAAAKAAGKPGVTINNVYDEPGSTKYLGSPRNLHIVFDPTKVRSAFAQFDPAKLHLNDLLAGLAGAGIIAPQVLQKGDE